MKIAAPFVVGLLASGWAAGASEKPPTNPLCALDNERYHVDFLSGHYCCPNELVFWVEDRETGEEGRVAVETQVLLAERMTLVAGSKIFVTGRMERDVKAIVIVDMKSGLQKSPSTPKGALQDELHAYDFRLSPSQELLVYSRRYERQEAGEERRPLLLLYDLTATAADNRAAGAGAPGVGNAGVPIYPEVNAREGSYDPRLDPPHRYLSTLAWSDDGRRIVFVDGFAGKLWLVTVDLAAGRTPPDVRKKEIRAVDLAPGAPAGDLGMPVVTLSWKDESTVELQALLDGDLQPALAVAVP